MGWHLYPCVKLERARKRGGLANIHNTDVHVFVGAAIQQDLLAGTALLGCQCGGNVSVGKRAAISEYPYYYAMIRTRCAEQDDRSWDIVLL